ncbi:methyltransferase [Photobacterium jeanii]|uniref:Methyltransferase n=2 Tax=Photobacterium jeanii TaxID=858640 RepID=A0A178K4E7_9GAMM|nr:methyltransferase [Photobacterium jeanii]PST91113.1 class I SAM-dependent methyltransferase [Photobacterium jeanii]
MKAEYDLIAEQWLAARVELPEKDQQLLDRFIQLLPPNPRVLDLGCGSGVPIAKSLVNQGCAITGVDRSKCLLEHAQHLMPEQTWVHSELEDYCPADSFDGIMFWDSIFHIPRTEHTSLLKMAFSALKPKGVLMLSSGGSDKNIPAFTDYMFEQQFYYDALPMEELISLCRTIGFTLEQRVMVNQPDGKRDKGRLGLLLRK